MECIADTILTHLKNAETRGAGNIKNKMNPQELRQSTRCTLIHVRLGVLW